MFKKIFMFGRKYKKTPNTLSKYEKISPEPYLKAAKKEPELASRMLKDRYAELSDYAASFAIGGIYYDENLKDWLRLAEILSESHPSLAKSIYIPVMRALHYNLQRDLQSVQVLDIRFVALKLYELEQKYPEEIKEGKISVLSALVLCASPDQEFWNECLEQCYILACLLDNIYLIVKVALYAENIPSLKERALNEISYRLKNPDFLNNENNPNISKGYFFSSMNVFCVNERGSSRNKAFEASSNSDVYLLLNQIFFEWVEKRIEEKSYQALELLEFAICSHDKELSLKASNMYKQNFYDIAIHNPQDASKCLRRIASSTGSNFDLTTSKNDTHQNTNLCDVFDYTISILLKIDYEIGITTFFVFLGSTHGGPSYKLHHKYSSEIGLAWQKRDES